MLKRIILLIVGFLLIFLVIFLGFKSTKNSFFVVWYGLACALLAPVGINCITDVFNIGNKEKIKKLLKVPEIDELIQKAETQEEKIKLLEEERKQLSNIVRYETLKHAAIERRKYLEYEAENILKEYDKVETEIRQLELEQKEDRLANQVIDELYKKLENNGEPQNADLMILTILNSLPIHIPFLSTIVLLSNFLFNEIRKMRIFRKCKKDD